MISRRLSPRAQLRQGDGFYALVHEPAVRPDRGHPQAVQSDPGALRALQGQLGPHDPNLAVNAELQPQPILWLLLRQQVGLDHLLAPQGDAQLSPGHVVNAQQLLHGAEVPVVQGVLRHVK